ncbi:hypothetical protein, partial [Pantoea ananatis]|uniref:hypothetical protein n=1 Tax=Pantoea ananas TaxID=553 RepID=UPI003D0B5330
AADRTDFIDAATGVGGDVADREVMTVEKDGALRFFVVNDVTNEAQEVTATFNHDVGVTDDVTLDTVAAGKVLSAVDADMLIHGKPTLSDNDTKRIKTNDTVKVGADDVVLDAAKLDAISNAAFGRDVAD